MSLLQSPAPEPTLVSVVTPPGRAAVATVVIVGPRAVTMADSCFRPAGTRSLSASPLRRIVFGRWGDPPGEEVVACRRSPQRVEIHGHGGAAAPAQIVRSLAALGCQVVPWQTLPHAAGLSPSLAATKSQRSIELQAGQAGEIIRAEAAEVLPHCLTRRTARLVLEQYQGALAVAAHGALVAASAGEMPAAQEQLNNLVRWSHLGLHAAHPFRVVLAGDPNVGKSSILNCLLGYARSIVTPTPGTTRDVVSELAAIRGWPVLLTDTAGLRRNADRLESAGMALTQAEAAAADLVILVADAAAPNRESLAELEQRYPHALRVANKVDLLGPNKPPTSLGLPISAQTGEGLAALADSIVMRLVPDEPPEGDAVPFTMRQIGCLDAARRFVSQQNAEEAVKHLTKLLCG